MSLWLVLTLILTPAIAWIGYAYYYDRRKPEPLILTASAFLLGYLSALLCLRLYDFLPLLGIPYDPEALQGLNWKFLAYCLGPVGLLEECCKLLPFLIVIHFHDFDEEADSLFYSAVIALGFASFENVNILPTIEGFPLFGRAVASPLTHTIFASIWGYWIGMAKIRGEKIAPALVKGLLFSALAHGIFDFLTFSPVWRLTGALLILFIWLWRIRESELQAKRDQAAGGASPC